MYGTDGFQLLAEMRKDRTPLPPIIFVTAMHNDVLKESAERQGVAACLNKKSLTPEGFYDAITRAIA
jgi:CheY-like chemotaxis protein